LEPESVAGSKTSEDTEAVGRYAGALLELASEKGELTNISKEFKDFVVMATGSKDVTRLLQSPAFGRQEKALALAKIAEQAGYSVLFANFLGAMVANGRARNLVAAGAAFDALYARQKGVQRVVVRTAAAMTAAQTARIETLVRGAVGGEIELSREVDPALVGGIQLRIGSKLIDASLAAKLNRMNTAMKGA
jgi:F-type H+-transporting ATPase subunit delta